MITVNNIKREQARNWDQPLDPDKNIWICIGEPEPKYDSVRNKILDTLPNFHINFWDVVVPVCIYDFVKGEKTGTAMPPDMKDAREIVDFILQHKDKNVIVNCKAGKARSGAVAQFCHDFLGYEWGGEGLKRAVPNKLLYDLMKDYYLAFNPEPVKTVDKRRVKL